MKETNHSNLPLRSGRNKGKDNSFYNTIHLQDTDLAKAKKQVETQESKILDFLKANSKQKFTKHEIKIALVKLGRIRANTPESSISRALSNLYKDVKILKLDEMRLGEFDKPNLLWQVVLEPLQVATQTVLF